MNKTFIALVLTITFMSLTIAPSVIAIFDDSFDISFILNLTEEEEKKGEEKLKNIEVIAPSNEKIEHQNFKTEKPLKNYLKEDYSSYFIELNSPPPELNIFN